MLKPSPFLLVLNLSAILFLALLPSFSLPAVLTLVQREWGMSSGQAGIVLSSFQAGYIAAAVIALPLTDRVDARYVIAGGAALCCLSHLLFPLLAFDPVSGSVVRALAGAGLGGVYMPGLRLASLVPAMKGRAVGTYVSSYLVGTAFSFAATGMLIALMPWKAAYLWISITSSLAFLASYYLIRQPMPEAMAAVPERPQVLRGEHPKESWRVRLPSILIIAAYVAHMWELYGLRSWLAPFMVQVVGAGTPGAASKAAALASISVLLSAFSTIIGGWLSDRIGRIATALTIMLISGACSLTFGWLLGQPFFWLALVGIIYSLTIVADSPIFSTSITELTPPERLGRMMAWQTFLGYGAATISPAVFGFVLDAFPGRAGWGWGFVTLGTGALLGPIFLLLMQRLPERERLCGGKG